MSNPREVAPYGSIVGKANMRCIFCKSSTNGCQSEEHIIPESLGNVEHILPPGWVCDDCNNYLSREVEAPFLNSWYDVAADGRSLDAKRTELLPLEKLGPMNDSIRSFFQSVPVTI